MSKTIDFEKKNEFQRSNIKRGKNFKDPKLREEKLRLQKFKDLLTGEKLIPGNTHYHHIDYDINNDNQDNLAFISTKTHMKITGAQVRNLIEAEWYKIQLQENLIALKEGRKPILQKKAIKNIEKYWTNRVRNYRNWKFQKHWSYKKESISSRLDRYTFESLKGNNNSRSIQNFVRIFLRDKKFRKKFKDILWDQFEKDPSDPRMELLQYLDITDNKQSLIEIFPHVVSGIVYVVEKELISFYFTFMSGFSVSYAIRVGLIHFRYLENQDPIKKEEVLAILNELINEKG